jgi:hypothetical protein
MSIRSSANEYRHFQFKSIVDLFTFQKYKYYYTYIKLWIFAFVFSECETLFFTLMEELEIRMLK